MYNPLKLQSPVILPPESISQNWISKENFDLKETLHFHLNLNLVILQIKNWDFLFFLLILLIPNLLEPAQLGLA